MTTYADIDTVAGALEVFKAIHLTKPNGRPVLFDDFVIDALKEYDEYGLALEKDPNWERKVLGLLTLAAEAMIGRHHRISEMYEDANRAWNYRLEPRTWAGRGCPEGFNAQHPLRCMACLMAVEKIDDSRSH